MTFVFRIRIAGFTPVGGGHPVALSSLCTSNELYRVAGGGLLTLEELAAGPRAKLIDLHLCRNMFKAWASTATDRRLPFVFLPGYERVTMQQNATRYACLATLLDVHMHPNLIDICAAYSDIEPPNPAAAAAAAAEAAAAATARGALGSCVCCGGKESLNSTSGARRAKRLRPADESTEVGDARGVKRVRRSSI